MSNLMTYVEKYGLISLEKQDKLEHLVGEHTYELDLDTGKARFNDLQFPIQILGTESDNTLTWLWAWAEEQAEIPAGLIASSLDLRTWGISTGVQELSKPSVDLNEADGLQFSLVASEICKASSYYRDVYEGGALYILLFGKAIDSQPPFDLNRLRKRLLFLISSYNLNHRNMLLSYLALKGLSPLATESRIMGRLWTGEFVTAEFDSSGNITLFNGEVITP